MATRYRRNQVLTSELQGYKDRYQAYIRSRRWFARRDRWYKAELSECGRVGCAVCGEDWTPQTGHLHHVTYENLGRESHEDLVALCGECHETLHQMLDMLPWRDRTAFMQRQMIARMAQAVQG